MNQTRSPPAPVEPKNRDVFRTSPDSDQFMYNHKAKDFYGKDLTDLGSPIRETDIFGDSKYSRDSFGMIRDLSPKSRDSFGMPSARDIGVVANTRDSFANARQSFKKLEGDTDRRSSVASTMVNNISLLI